jgi:hypothetical protein
MDVSGYEQSAQKAGNKFRVRHIAAARTSTVASLNRRIELSH